MGTVAVIVACWPPPVTPVTRPVLLTVAYVVLLLLQVAKLVSAVPLSVAVSCTEVPLVTVVLPVLVATVRLLDSVLGPTSTLTVAEPSSCVAVIVAVPAATVVTVPPLTVRTLAFDEVHLAVEDTSLASPFTVVPDAVRVTVCPAAATKEPGEIVMLAMESPEVKKPEHPASSIKQITATAKKPLRTNCTALPPGDFLQLHCMID
jgi:hypothetical protein